MDKMCGKNGKEIEYLWVKENLIVSQQKSQRIIHVFHILCDMGLPCSKLNNSKFIKDRNIIFAVSKRYIYHLYRNDEKSNIRNNLGAYLFSKVRICDAKIAYLDDIANLEILPYRLHFSEVMSFTKSIKDVDG